VDKNLLLNILQNNRVLHDSEHLKVQLENQSVHVVDDQLNILGFKADLVMYHPPSSHMLLTVPMGADIVMNQSTDYIGAFNRLIKSEHNGLTFIYAMTPPKGVEWADIFLLRDEIYKYSQNMHIHVSGHWKMIILQRLIYEDAYVSETDLAMLKSQLHTYYEDLEGCVLGSPYNGQNSPSFAVRVVNGREGKIVLSPRSELFKRAELSHRLQY